MSQALSKSGAVPFALHADSPLKSIIPEQVEIFKNHLEGLILNLNCGKNLRIRHFLNEKEIPQKPG
jgi:hypothetical protein